MANAVLSLLNLATQLLDRQMAAQAGRFKPGVASASAFAVFARRGAAAGDRS